MYTTTTPTNWKNKVILVTGGGSGLGKSIAECYASEGAQVIVCSRRESITTLFSDEYPNITGYRCDVRNYDDVKNLFDKIREKFGKIDILINNAGRACNMEDINVRTHLYPVDQWTDIVATNLYGVFYVSREALKLMLENKTKGCIITISSACALRVTPGQGSYSISKGAVKNLTELMADEYGRDGIRVLDIMPGYFPNTEIFDGRSKEELALYEACSGIGRSGKNWEVAELCKYLSSEKAGYMTGNHIQIDGGHLAGVDSMVGMVWNKE